MKRKNSLARWKPVAWSLLAVCSFLLFLTVLIGVLYVQFHFSFSVEESLYLSDRIPLSPQFYVYRFSDRANRVGVPADVTQEVYRQKQTVYLSYEEIPEELVHAFVAIEDKRFFEHRGVDLWRTLAAGANYVLGFSDRFGASTITQQLIKNMSGEDDVTVTRKLQEILYAWDLERRLDKTEIMELYLNIIHFSDNCDGIAAAAEHYFSKTVDQLTVSECAAIAAITNNPSYYNPIRHPENNRTRRDLILLQMYEQGYLSETVYRSAVASPTVLTVDQTTGTEGINSWYTDMVIADVIRDLMEEYGMSRSAASHLLYTGGVRIDMAMDEEVQAIVEEHYRTSVHLPQNASGETAQSAVIVLDNRTGDILGVAGAVGEKKGNHLQNLATDTKRPPGSTIKPLTVYAPALEQGLITPASVYDDVPVKFDPATEAPWPKNADRIWRGLTSVSYAVAHSTNTVAIRILEEVGVQEAYRYAKEKFRLKSMIEADRDLAALGLGQLHYGVTLRELCGAYTAFADAGVYHAPRSYYRVLDRDGKVLLSRTEKGEVILSGETAALMTKLLEGVVREGTDGAVTLSARVNCAGKTGTTTQTGDRWFVGYTPELVCGVWCGYEYPEPLTGRNQATGIWNALMRTIYDAKGGRTSFETPSSLVRATYCRDSGKLMTEACTKDPRGDRATLGWFVRGSEPTAFCDCHICVPYDRESGGVSHGSCPEEVTDEIALIRVTRDLPNGIKVADAGYVWGGDPEDIPQNPDPDRPYFAADDGGDPYGTPAALPPLNRSCPRHTGEEERARIFWHPWRSHLPKE